MPEIRPHPNLPEKSLRDVYTVIFRHKTKVLWFFFSLMATLIVGTLLAANIYQSTAKLMVRLGRESVSLDPTATTGKMINISTDSETQINSELEILNSRELAERVVDALGVQIILYGPVQTPLPEVVLQRPKISSWV
jgi:uncharacterized protein involved in exopolysaccharide biosynthesis